MNRRHYFPLVLVLPSLVALVLLGPGWRLPLGLDEAGTTSGLSLYPALLPFVAFTAAICLRVRRKSEKTFERIVLLSPLLSLPFAVACWLILNYDAREETVRNAGGFDLLILSSIILFCGYVYVFIARGLYTLAARLFKLAASEHLQ